MPPKTTVRRQRTRSPVVVEFFCAGLCPGRGRGHSGMGRRGRHCLVVGLAVTAVVVVVAVVINGSWSCGSGGGTAAAAFRVSFISARCSEWHVHALPLLHRSLRRLRWQSAAGADVHLASCLHLLRTANLRPYIPYMLGLKFLAKLLFSLQVHCAWLARVCGRQIKFPRAPQTYVSLVLPDMPLQLIRSLFYEVF